jgi:hypothetical protein
MKKLMQAAVFAVIAAGTLALVIPTPVVNAWICQLHPMPGVRSHRRLPRLGFEARPIRRPQPASAWRSSEA